MSEGVKVKEHVLNLINALTNLSPSRSTISQLILLLPEDQAVFERSYPEATSPDAKIILESLGVKVGDKLERTQNSFAENLYKHIHKIFDWLDDELIYGEWRTIGQYGVFETFERMSDVRSSLAKLTGTHIDSIPNPYKEWAKLVLGKLSTLYGKDKVFRLLKALIDQGSFSRDREYKGRALQEFFNKLGAQVAMSPPEMKELQKFTVLIEGESEYIYRKARRYPGGNLWIEHGKYHLDPLICESYQYESYQGWSEYYEYRVRHKESLSEALKEAFAWENR